MHHFHLFITEKWLNQLGNDDKQQHIDGSGELTTLGRKTIENPIWRTDMNSKKYNGDV